MLTKRIVMPAIVLCVIFAAALYIRNVMAEWERIITSDIARQVVVFRMYMWTYYVKNGRPANCLCELVPSIGQTNVLHFATDQGIPCRLSYSPVLSGNMKAMAVVRCGDPVLAEFKIAGNGEVISERYKRHIWWYAYRNQRVSLPKLTRLLWKTQSATRGP